MSVEFGGIRPGKPLFNRRLAKILVGSTFTRKGNMVDLTDRHMHSLCLSC